MSAGLPSALLEITRSFPTRALPYTQWSYCGDDRARLEKLNEFQYGVSH